MTDLTAIDPRPAAARPAGAETSPSPASGGCSGSSSRKHRLAVVEPRRRRPASTSSRPSPTSSRPSDPNATNAALHLRAAAGAVALRTTARFAPARHRLKMTLDTESHAPGVRPRPGKARSSVGFFVPRPSPTRSSASSRCSTKLFGPPTRSPATAMYLFGADRLGRDMLLARRARRAGLAVDRPRRRRSSASSSGSTIGGISGYLRRLGRHGHPARHRVPALDPDHPALDGPRRRDPASPGRRSAPISSSPSSCR